MVAQGVTGDQIKIFGSQEIRLAIGDKIISHCFVTCDFPLKYDGIIGLDLLGRLGAKVDVVEEKLIIASDAEELANLFRVGESDKGPATSSLIDMRRVARVTCAESVTLPPMSETVIPCRLDTASFEFNNDVIVHASQVEDERCVFVGRAVCRPMGSTVCRSTRVVDLGAPVESIVYVKVMNCSPERTTFHRNQVLSYAEDCGRYFVFDTQESCVNCGFPIVMKYFTLYLWLKIRII
jgi:hypothetical protein